MGLRVGRLEDHMFGHCIWLLLGERDEANAWARERYGKKVGLGRWPDGSCSKFRSNKDGVCEWVVWLQAFTYEWDQVGVLVHELFHCVHSVLLELGMRCTPSSEEVFAYYQGHLLALAFAALRAEEPERVLPH